MKRPVVISKPVHDKDKMELGRQLAIQGTDFVDNIELTLEVTVGTMRAIAERFEAIAAALS